MGDMGSMGGMGFIFPIIPIIPISPLKTSPSKKFYRNSIDKLWYQRILAPSTD